MLRTLLYHPISLGAVMLEVWPAVHFNQLPLSDVRVMSLGDGVCACVHVAKDTE